MTTPVPPTEILVAPSTEPTEPIEAVRKLMLTALLRRGVARTDAEDAVQGVLERLLRRPDLASKVAGGDEHAGYFVRAAINQHLMALRAERCLRAREQLYVERGSAAAAIALGDVDRHRVREALEVAASVDLTARQREYVQAVLVEGRSLQQLAAATGTSVKAVQAVLARATAAMHKHLAQHRP